MQDTILGNNATAPGMGPVPVSLKKRLNRQDRLELQNRLLQVLQQSLDPDTLLRHFFNHLQPLITVGGIHLLLAENGGEYHCGKQAIHHIDYRLNLQQRFLGEIVFSRAKRFSEEELALLESLLANLVFPLRNALDYRAALLLSFRDALTGLGNRAALDQTLLRELQLAERHGQDLSLLMIDLDHFKKINDHYGHAKGDEALKAVTATIQVACRNSDICFRFGGEEFIVLLPKTNGSGARIIAERIREQVEQLVVDNGQTTINPTVSIGIATLALGQGDTVESLFARADKALYRAKTEGRNRTHDLAC